MNKPNLWQFFSNGQLAPIIPEEELIAHIKSGKYDLDAPLNEINGSVIMFGGHVREISIAVLEALIDSGASFDKKAKTPAVTFPSSYTPLISASYYGRTDFVDLLLRKGADVNESHLGYSALHGVAGPDSRYFGKRVSVEARYQIIDTLLNMGCDIDRKTWEIALPNNGVILQDHTPVSIALGVGTNEAREVATYLFAHGANPFVEVGGQNLIDMAETTEMKFIVSAAQTTYGETKLRLARARKDNPLGIRSRTAEVFVNTGGLVAGFVPAEPGERITDAVTKPWRGSRHPGVGL